MIQKFQNHCSGPIHSINPPSLSTNYPTDQIHRQTQYIHPSPNPFPPFSDPSLPLKNRNKNPSMATLSLLRFSPLPPRLTCPSLGVNLRPNPSIKIRPRLPPISASYTVPFNDRLISVVSYTYPFLNFLCHCRILMSRYPLLASLASQFPPMPTVVHSVAELAAFFAILHGLVPNPKTSVYVRFNARQAVLLDAMLTLLLLVEKVFGIPSDGVGVTFVQFGYGAVFVLVFASFVYNVLCCVVGRTPYLPFVSSFVKSLL